MKSLTRRLLALVPVLILLALFVVAAVVPEVRNALSKEGLQVIIERAGVWAPVGIVVAMALAIVVSPLPNVPIAAFLGMIYGPWAGTAIALAGAILGASIAFGISRRFGTAAVRALAGKTVRFCQGCSERSLTVIVLAARLIPIVSFDLISYGAGLSEMRFGRFFWATLIGMIPWTWFYVTFGAAVLDNPVLATILGIALAAAVLLLPMLVRKYNIFGLRDTMMVSDEE